ncbi:flagellar hook assembly protein FlgD [Parerythrobacter jejuensis]|uniref:Basal-body rod modification protein FlgD n=1 Tax=Parerythrobacter jejuensis TaxID=795812 RepID=A0A845AUR7_9SPHN|nr:flagellar hook capping FlgD N-terminal domain-containing protein [Parerythrobacter jejuensis]MXP30574.1 flagellar hook capping protein [Parerythrobacter jejuensis]MXP33334.1 flagellar hook capping protein [Parerythrobacter jejuensis]
MQAVAPVAPAQPTPPVDDSNTQGASSATDQFGLGFESLLQIVLTQLTYQDPLEPMDNFEFVSQLAQFSQIQQTQEMADSLETLVAAQSTGQAASLLGRTVDVAAGNGSLTGVVTAVAFQNGTPALTIDTEDGNTISGLPLGNVTQIRETP